MKPAILLVLLAATALGSMPVRIFDETTDHSVSHAVIEEIHAGKTYFVAAPGTSNCMILRLMDGLPSNGHPTTIVTFLHYPSTEGGRQYWCGTGQYRNDLHNVGRSVLGTLDSYILDLSAAMISSKNR